MNITAMKTKIEELDYYVNLFDEFYCKRVSYMIRLTCSSEENHQKIKYKRNLYTVYLEFISEKINKLKLEL